MLWTKSLSYRRPYASEAGQIKRGIVHQEQVSGDGRGSKSRPTNAVATELISVLRTEGVVSRHASAFAGGSPTRSKPHLFCGRERAALEAYAHQGPSFEGPWLVAGAGFEPATFGL
jgi:hypothetical protein